MRSPLPAFVLSFVAFTAPATPPADAPRMNVLLLISDDLRTEMGCYASTLARTPHLDRLAASSLRFDRAYCQFPLCNPSRTSMLTGRMPRTTGALGNRTWFGDAHPDWRSLPRYFKDQGYTTVGIGKIFHGGIDDTDAWSIGGKPRVLAGVSPSATNTPPRRTPARNTGATLSKNEKSDRIVVLPGNGESHADYRSASRAIEMLRAHTNQPFFIACGFLKPHSPPEAPQSCFDQWDPAKIPLPPDFAPRPTVPGGFPAGSIRPQNTDLFIGRDASPAQAREMIRAYLASTTFMDANAGRVLDALDELGLSDRTIVVFWSDHGYQLGEKGKWSKAGSLWEQGARTPLLIRDPRATNSLGRTSPRVVQMIDLYPTLVELCGLPPVAGLEGRSLAPLLRDPATPWDHPAYTVWSEDSRHFSGVAVRTERWRYAEFWGRGPGRMLLDPAADPHETNNLAADPRHAEVVKQLSELARAHAAGLLPPEPPPR
jgi:arylsulfatase A-like enzyme